MSANLSIQLSEQAFTSLANQASAVGTTPSELAASIVENIYASGHSEPPDPAIARARFERCFGSVDLGRPVGVSNEAIDADLAREYGATAGSS